MKKTILTIITSTMIAGASSAAIDLTTGYSSDYYFRGVQLADSIIEAAIDYSEGDFYAGVWTAQPVERGDGGLWENEIDFYAGYGAALSDIIAADIGFTAYVYPELEDGDTTTWEPFVGFAFDTELAPAIYFYYDVTLETFTVEGSVGHSFEIDEMTSFDIGAYVGNASPDGGDDTTYYGLSAGVGYSLSDTASLSASINYQDAEDVVNQDDGLYFSVGITGSF